MPITHLKKTLLCCHFHRQEEGQSWPKLWDLLTLNRLVLNSIVKFTLMRKLIPPANSKTAIILRTSLTTLTSKLSFDCPSPWNTIAEKKCEDNDNGKSKYMWAWADMHQLKFCKHFRNRRLIILRWVQNFEGPFLIPKYKILRSYVGIHVFWKNWIKVVSSNPFLNLLHSQPSWFLLF